MFWGNTTEEWWLFRPKQAFTLIAPCKSSFHKQSFLNRELLKLKIVLIFLLLVFRSMKLYLCRRMLNVRCSIFRLFCQGPRNLFTYLFICRWERSACHVVSIWRSVSREDWIPISVFTRSVLDSIHQNHLGREGLRWNDGHLMTCYTEWKLSVIFVWENASKLFTQEMVYINLLFDCTVIKKFAQFYADISYI